MSPIHVGRTEELDRLVATISAPPAVAVIEGEAGIGKTRLLSEARSRPELAGRRFLSGSCRQIREPFPLGPIVEAVRGLADHLSGRELPPVSGALRPLIPELADLLPPSLDPLDDRAAERHRVFRGLRDILGATGPAVLAIEDLHWVDGQTVDFLGYLLGNPPPDLAVVLTLRDEVLPAGVRGLTARLPETVGHTHCLLLPLDQEHTGALAAGLLDIEQVSDEFASYLRERTSGLPLAIQELLALLRARGTLVRREGGWARRALDELDVPVRIRDQVLERVGRLSVNARAVAETAAVLQLAVPLSVLVATCQAPEDEALAGVEEALHAGLLVEQGDLVGFRHLLAAQAVYEDVPLPRRRLLHGRAAEALQRERQPPPGQVAHHLRHTDRLEEWATAAEDAADRALDLGHEEEAVRLLDDVLRHAPLSVPDRGRIAVKLGRAAVEAVGSTDSTTLLSETLDHAPDLPPVVRGELRLLLGRLLASAGSDPNRRRQLYTDALADLDERPDLKALAMIALAIPTTSDADLAERKHWVNQALEIVARSDERSFEAFLLGKIALLLMWFGDPQWREVTERLVAQTGQAPRHHLEVDAYCSIGWGACHPGHYDTAERLLTAALDGAVAGESRLQELRARSALALLDYCRGAWADLPDQLRALTAELAAYAPARIEVEMVGCCLALARGDADAATRLVEVTRAAEVLGPSDLPPIAAVALGRLAASRDAPGAAEGAWRLATMLESQGMWVPGIRALPALADAACAAGEDARATALVSRWSQELRGLDAPLAEAALPHARGVLAAGRRQWTEAVEQLLAAADRYAELGCPYETAQAREQAARAMLESAPEAGAPVLRSAVSTYQELGARWDLDRATSLARRHDIALPARHRGGRRGYGSDLSPREREVAQLAAAGHTNREIAERLFLSPNTVKRHLAAAMRKLDVRSRVALSRRIAVDDPVDASKIGRIGS